MVTIPTSYKGLSKDVALEMAVTLCNLVYQFKEESNLENLHKPLKQLMGLYCDCKCARYELSQSLLKQQFVPFAVKTLKRLNNTGVFKNDDIWFSTFYLYNICWNYSEMNPLFASALMVSGIDGLLTSNLMHIPYIDNLSKKNVHYLIKSSLSVIHNIVRVPGFKVYFSSPNIINALLVLAKREDILSMLSTICLGFIACNENVKSDSNFDVYFNIKLIILCVNTASKSGAKYKGFSILEFLEVLRASSLCKLQRKAILSLGFDILVDHLLITKDDREKCEILLILSNVVDESNISKIREIIEDSKYFEICEKVNSVKDFQASNETITMERLAGVVKDVLWRLAVTEGDIKAVCGVGSVFINFAERDLFTASKIFESLTDCRKVPLRSYEYECESLKKAYDDASIIIVCISESYKNSHNFATGSQYCLGQKKVVFPVLVDQTYKPEGWLKDFIVETSDVCYNLSTSDVLSTEWQTFKNDVMAQISSVADDAAFDGNLEKMDTLDSAEEEVHTSEPVVVNEVDLWLVAHDLGHLQLKMSSINMQMLVSLKTIRKEAPEYYFKALEKNLCLTFPECLELYSAMDSF